MFEETFGELIVMVLSSGKPRKNLEVWFGVTTKLPQIPYFDLWKTSLPRQHGLGKCVSWETTPGEQIGTYKRHLRFEGSRSWRWFFVLETLAGKQRSWCGATRRKPKRRKCVSLRLSSGDSSVLEDLLWVIKVRSIGRGSTGESREVCVLKWTRDARIEE